VVVPDAAHNVMSDNPLAFRNEIANFLGVHAWTPSHAP